MMSSLWLHSGGWDEMLLLVGAVALAFLIVRFTSRSDTNEGDDRPPDER